VPSTYKKPIAIAFALLLACCGCAFALDPSLEVNQYAHTAWTVREGFFKSGVYPIAQTPDGYLWLGTQFGFASLRRREDQPVALWGPASPLEPNP